MIVEDGLGRLNGLCPQASPVVVERCVGAELVAGEFGHHGVPGGPELRLVLAIGVSGGGCDFFVVGRGVVSTVEIPSSELIRSRRLLAGALFDAR